VNTEGIEESWHVTGTDDHHSSFVYTYEVCPGPIPMKTAVIILIRLEAGCNFIFHEVEIKLRVLKVMPKWSESDRSRMARADEK
jgi:hypothetical protein